MNIETAVVWIKSYKSLWDGIFAISSLVVVPTIAVAPLAWVFEHPGSVHSSLHAFKTVGGHELKGDLQFTQEPLKVRYHLELVNPVTGDIVAFPQVESSGTPRLDNVMLPIPKSVKPGEYQLRAQVHYVINPLKYVDQTVQVASIQVD